MFNYFYNTCHIDRVIVWISVVSSIKLQFFDLVIEKKVKYKY